MSQPLKLHVREPFRQFAEVREFQNLRQQVVLKEMLKENRQGFRMHLLR